MLRLVSVVVPLLLLTTACGQDAAPRTESATESPTSEAPTASATSSATSSAETPTETPAGSASEVPELLDFTGVTVDGAAFEGASLAGRPTVLWFWAPWCPTCRGQVPQVEALEKEHAGEVNVIGVGSLDSAEAIAEFADDVSGVTHLEDVDGELWRRFGVTEQSSFVVLDADGTVVLEAGYGGTDDLDAEVESLLG
ncbi:MAG TPA: redoxin family protein [Nocardioides sp.]|nr:redoxin family protein [Nocardioides sp.]